MAFVYLIKEDNNTNNYKIGVTKAHDINKRMKKLQTGNSSQLILADYYTTNNPFKLETVLHKYFANKHVLNEWFELSDDDVKNFHTICDKYEKIFQSLKDNPFLNIS